MHTDRGVRLVTDRELAPDTRSRRTSSHPRLRRHRRSPRQRRYRLRPHGTRCGGRFRSSPTSHTSSSRGRWVAAVGTPDTNMGATPVSSHTASRDLGELGSSFRSQPEGGRHLESQTHPGPPQCHGTKPRSTPTALSGTHSLPARQVDGRRGRVGVPRVVPVLKRPRSTLLALSVGQIVP